MFQLPSSLRKRKKLAFILLSGGLGLGLSIAVLFVSLPALFSSKPFLNFHQMVQSPAGAHNFMLFSGYSGIGDPVWYVLKINKGVDPSRLKVPSKYMNGKESGDKEWISKTVLWNYSEDGSHTENPHIIIIDSRFIAFIRGGLFYGLYDIDTGTALVDDHSPWHSFLDSVSDDLDLTQRRFLFKAWVGENIDSKIKNLIK